MGLFKVDKTKPLFICSHLKECNASKDFCHHSSAHNYRLREELAPCTKMKCDVVEKFVSCVEVEK